VGYGRMTDPAKRSLTIFILIEPDSETAK